MKTLKNHKIQKNIIIALFLVIGIPTLWFNLPFSPLKSEFKNDLSNTIEKNTLDTHQDFFSAKDFETFPMPVQKYIEKSGYIGKEKMSFLKMKYKDVDFMQGQNGPKLKIDYTQYNFVKNPDRLAFIDSSMLGVSFEGYDSYKNGKGGMKGVIAKLITLFNQQGDEMDKACLVTFLAESFFAPNILLQDYITFEALDDFSVKATINYKGASTGGIFTFNEQYEMTSFTTNDRAVIGADGNIEYVKWTAVCENYQQAENGIKYPTQFKAIWNYPDKDFVYFDGKISAVEYDGK